MDAKEQIEEGKLRVAFIHPDLGIGGAERLIVDAALGIQNKGHVVSIHTSHHDPDHCFDETRDGTLQVIHHKPPVFLPRSLHGKFHILFAHLRQLHLTWQLIRAGTSEAGPSGVDIFFVDQLSTCLPILRFFTGRRVVFYCHFPDKLLASGEFIDEDEDVFPSASVKPSTSTSNTQQPTQVAPRTAKPTSLLKKLYRVPMDYLEEQTTATADLILVNSLFTSRVFKRYFPTIKLDDRGMKLGAKRAPGGPRVVYPGINLEAYEQPVEASPEDENLASDRPTFISLNRFEEKKNIPLAVNAFSLFLSNSSVKKDPRLTRARLVLGGGYDPRVQENVDMLKLLVSLISSLKMTWALISTAKTPVELPEEVSGQVEPSAAQVILLPNFSTAQRSILLKSSSTMALLYTPNNEHFGIVPVEAMACGLPVLACKSGGPKESVLDEEDEPTAPNVQGKELDGDWSVLDLAAKSTANITDAIPKIKRTGYLRPPDPTQWAQVLLTIATLPPSTRHAIAQAARTRAKEHFSMDALARGIERALKDAYRLGPVRGAIERESVTEVLVWAYVLAVIVSLWFFGGACTMGWTAVLLLTTTALGGSGILKM